MKKILSIFTLVCFSLIAKTQELSGTTIGFSFGPSFQSSNPYDYSLSPDSNRLVLQKLTRTSFVISTVLTIKFNNLSLGQKETGAGNNKRTTKFFSLTNETGFQNKSGTNPAKWYQRFALNIGLNLAEVNTSNVSFNKQIDGGIGLGCFLTENIQLATFFDIIRSRQMRNTIVEKYEGKPIPNGAAFYNALDPADNKLFYNKTFTGLSLKIVIALNPKKADK